ncbi:hypothetical protein ABEB36_006649 [Hypothenemus hampei]|uniref:Transmembrane protein 234 n=1 Tax=Hypothenemus hampei TaxID=57062 RepID=A0ABD1ERA1_HYPHA
MFYEFLSLLCVSALWGLTNPYIKKNSKSIEKIKSESIFIQFFLELKYLMTNFHYLIPMGLNQLGSLLYFITLQNIDLTLSVPLANSLTFIFTAMSGIHLKERRPSKRILFGCAFILIGTGLCCYDKHR